MILSTLNCKIYDRLPQVCFTIRLAKYEKIFNVPGNLAVQHVQHIHSLETEGLDVEIISNTVVALLYKLYTYLHTPFKISESNTINKKVQGERNMSAVYLFIFALSCLIV